MRFVSSFSAKILLLPCNLNYRIDLLTLVFSAVVSFELAMELTLAFPWFNSNFGLVNSLVLPVNVSFWLSSSIVFLDLR